MFLETVSAAQRHAASSPNRKGAKHGTNNTQQAAARDEAKAAAVAAVGMMADEALEDLLSPQPSPEGDVQPPAIEPTCEPSKGEMDSYKRMAIVSHYQRLGCPPKSEWGKHGGTLRQLADHYIQIFAICHPKYGHFFAVTPYIPSTPEQRTHIMSTSSTLAASGGHTE